MINRDSTEHYKKLFPELAKYYDLKYGPNNWVALRNQETGKYDVQLKGIFPMQKLRDKAAGIKRQELHIAETDNTGFVWLELTNEQAVLCVVSELFCVYVRHEDGSESMVERLEDFIELREEGFQFYLEVGYIDPDFFKMQG